MTYSLLNNDEVLGKGSTQAQVQKSTELELGFFEVFSQPNGT